MSIGHLSIVEKCLKKCELKSRVIVVEKNKWMRWKAECIASLWNDESKARILDC